MIYSFADSDVTLTSRRSSIERLVILVPSFKVYSRNFSCRLRFVRIGSLFC